MNSKRRLTKGQAMIEFVIIIPVLLLLIFGAIQIAFIYSAKTTLNYATFQAARVGATNHATYSALRRGLIRGLAPLFTNSGTLGDQRDDIAAGIDSGGTRRDAVFEVDNYTRIIRVNPTSAMLDVGGFGEVVDGNIAIPNDNLMYRPTWEVDGASIQDANLLKIRVQYCYLLMVPLVNKIIGSLSELNNRRDAASYREHHTINDPRFADANRGEVNAAADVTATYEELCQDRANNQEGFVLFSEAIVRMQSEAYFEDTDDTFESFMCDGTKMACP
ncbi:TadE/TadG family type IV pilus assembly protein [Gilvimarinus sp. SDUM040013]|uniref:TadE/TadG family type IV pilus assembly protein n=1 Tax=Gilvimarinus gilvus TaxID=3058038 RepID=A0ABU4RZZ8_9GAMM|nr:TadE/TadG family type IV pilus assembly protein [Gilvimarinus sp. SDUM040013]MDO3386259.1 TadE/TadG family type IV pilus assembly protein [Gilvimarinus sp. SDUM040013]MDX6849746.1 TadE/TadG family type IV pilus assembly protein [Gilvimarinus sp. SDUM040013]